MMVTMRSSSSLVSSPALMSVEVEVQSLMV
jgi:hypothetical protein